MTLRTGGVMAAHFTSNPTEVPDVWMVWDVCAGTDSAGVPLAQVHHGGMEECGLVADALNALPTHRRGTNP